MVAPSPASHGAAPMGRRSATLLARPAMWWPRSARRRVPDDAVQIDGDRSADGADVDRGGKA